MATRHQARMSVVSLLYAQEFNTAQNIDEFFEQHKIRNSLLVWAKELLNGVNTHKEQIDAKLSEFAQLEGVCAMDLMILRLGAYELLFTQIDKAVVINEAILLAKCYSSASSSALINGVLDNIN